MRWWHGHGPSFRNRRTPSIDPSPAGGEGGQHRAIPTLSVRAPFSQAGEGLGERAKASYADDLTPKRAR
ncbi:hypothetical protein Rmet_6582 [Cupriavidus metallidurans CH34]|uniref:Uncharacterized protein n=1 Tax=Cupriavidus metallidurans (strain ATCC 43123 / DSM 2839 / NBRC 102507 / CH34) TaxID=266264 RepID=D3DY13_CUPMC|nr:hypothetical protein Rmet_6582 [Cupriavidus metallidurans CH34]